MNVDSYDKIVTTYFAAVTAKSFVYKKKTYLPKPLYVSPAFFHEFTCKLGCAGCCSSRFTLDYLPTDTAPPMNLDPRNVEINGRLVRLFTYAQAPAAPGGNRFCDNVNLETGACMIHGTQPFSCDFETLRFTHFADHTWLGTRPYGRGWAMTRVDGKRGAVCDFPKTPTEAARADAIRKLVRLKEWTDAAGLQTVIQQVISWAQRAIQTKTAVFNIQGRTDEIIGQDHEVQV